MRTLVIALAPLASHAADEAAAGSTCADIKEAYRAESCCGSPTKVTNFQVVPMAEGDNAQTIFMNNYCEGKKPTDSPTEVGYFNNIDCKTSEGVVQALEQAGSDVTRDYTGTIDASGRDPINTPYYQAGLCPVNVHWHLGTEHRSEGEYDESYDEFGPPETRRLKETLRKTTGSHRVNDTRRLAADGSVRRGMRCHHYRNTDSKFTTEYNWKHCVDMKVGETYEVHWPHSAAGACNTPYQFQTPFYDGVFCKDGIVSLDPLNVHQKVGVQAQVFTIVNDENYYYPDLMRGMIVDHTTLDDGTDNDYGQDMATYTGSTTGTTRDNEICSRYTPITWQVDRTCHLISASSFDKMCADMKAQVDDMSGDLHAHGARELVLQELAANNHENMVGGER